MNTILLAEDEDLLRQEVAEFLSALGYRVVAVEDGERALAELKAKPVQVVITDIRMPKIDGLELVRKGRELAPDAAFLVMTAFGSLETAIQAMQAGAMDYLIKPLSMDELATKVQRVLEHGELKAANRMLRRDLERKLGPLEMVGACRALDQIRQLLKKVGPTRSSVLITGESGTGKELIARALHGLGAPKGEPFVPVNCAAIPETLLESELFGHEKGAFTGAVSESEGLFRAARRGTVFLDEIGDLSAALQAKLLRVLEDRMVHPVGSSKFIPFEARMLAATNQDLKESIRKKTFRDDLYFRLAVVEFHMPPLRERREDIPLLVQHCMQRFNRELNRRYTSISSPALQRLVEAPWKGNVRELQNAIERAMIVGTEPELTEADFILDPGSSAAPASPSGARNLRDAVRRFEQDHIRRMLDLCKGDKKVAATELGVSLSSLYRHLEGADSGGAETELED